MDSCLLFGGSQLRALGTPDPVLDEPYARHVGMIGTAVHRIGVATGCWHDCSTPVALDAYLAQTTLGVPDLADMVWMGLEKAGGGADPAYGGVSHLSVVTDFEFVALDDGTPIRAHVSTDGGQPDSPGFQILRRLRFYENTGTQLWARTLTETAPGSGTYKKSQGRRVWGVLSPISDALWSNAPAAPDGGPSPDDGTTPIGQASAAELRELLAHPNCGPLEKRIYNELLLLQTYGTTPGRLSSAVPNLSSPPRSE